MSVFVLNMTTMIGLGVGIDYSLLVVTRFREELARGARRQIAAVNALATAGRAVITSGLTVVVGFGALLLTPLIETRSVGIGGLIVVAVAVSLSITLLPALLAILGREIDRPKWLARRLAWYHAPQVWEKWARTLSRHPIRAMTYGGAVIGILTLPVFFIKIGLPSRHWWPSGTEAGDGLDVLTRMGVAGFIQPVRVMVQVPEGRSAVDATSLRGLMTLSDSLRADPRVREVRGLVTLEPKGGLLGYSVLYSDLPAAHAKYPDFLDAYLSRDHRLTLLDVILADTTSLTTATDVVLRARHLAKAQLRGTKGMAITVGGYSAAALDFQEDLLARFPLLVILILGATAVMLAIAFRSLLVPLKAIVMNTLSVSATFGLIVLVFQHGVGSRIFGLEGPTSAIFVAVPVLVFAVVFGLSMDYEVFLLSRIKEAFDRSGRNTEATMEGLSATASVITSAALIMILVFGIFAFARLLAMQLMGFGLAVAVLLDATVIRMVVVPAVMQAMGRWNWWPGVRRIRPKDRRSSEMPELREEEALARAEPDGAGREIGEPRRESHQRPADQRQHEQGADEADRRDPSRAVGRRARPERRQHFQACAANPGVRISPLLALVVTLRKAPHESRDRRELRKAKAGRRRPVAKPVLPGCPNLGVKAKRLPALPDAVEQRGGRLHHSGFHGIEHGLGVGELQVPGIRVRADEAHRTCPHRFASSQLGPTPMSTTSGTRSSTTCSI
jgi:RND superfamily putative drug exporter